MENPDLQFLLKEKFSHEGTKIIESRATKFLAENQNFCSAIRAIRIVLQRKNGQREVFSLIAKILDVNDEFAMEIDRGTDSFRTETRFYEQLSPLLTSAAVIIEGEKLDSPWPEFYGASKSVILLEDLRVANYHTLNALEGNRKIIKFKYPENFECKDK